MDEDELLTAAEAEQKDAEEDREDFGDETPGKPRSDNTEPVKTPEGVSYPHFNVAVNAEELAQGFQAPFTVSIVVDDKLTKGDLLKAVVSGINTIKEKMPEKEIDKYLAMYRKWACRVFNLSDRAFSSMDGLSNELAKVEQNLADAINAQPTVEQMAPIEIVGFGDDSGANDKTDGETDKK